MDKLFAIALTPEEMLAVMVALVVIRLQLPAATQVKWIGEAFDSAITKCEPLRIEAVKQIPDGKQKELNDFFERRTSEH